VKLILCDELQTDNGVEVVERLVRNTFNLPRWQNLWNIFGLGAFYGANEEVQIADQLARWEPECMQEARTT